jgi:intein/homing endonuclease
MIKYQFFPRSVGITDPIKQIIMCFNNVYEDIKSPNNNLKSNEVLAVLEDHLIKAGMKVESGKRRDQKLSVPVLFGINNKIDKYFDADGLSIDGKIVLEVEAGRATENNQFLKDIFQASMMYGVEYLVLAVRNNYRKHDDFEIIYTFLETLYISNRLHLPLKGILLIGY